MPRKLLNAVFCMSMGASALLGAGTNPLAADGMLRPSERVTNLTVTMDFAAVVQLPQPVSTVIVGNSGILDVALTDTNFMVLTGKATGSTNLILLDEMGERTTEYLVEVSPSRRKLTTVHQGSAKETYHCGNGCTPVLSVGNAPDFFDITRSQVQTRGAFSGTEGSDSAPAINMPLDALNRAGVLPP